MCWSGNPETPGMDSVQEAEKRTGKMFNTQSQRMDRIEFDALSSKMKELETEVESLKYKTLCLLVSFVVILIFTSFSVMNIIRQYSTIHDYYMDSQRIDQEIGQSLDKLIPKIEELQSEFK
ncbi:hypothetical protein [Mediterraneibacter gnavus]|uniref:hypothetical protein n=1 Tax=Mediterraneibacter gnavus TaxID=33038 RepID=UPI00232C5F7B|nr:hypothetical protein [Mediterraneibacter gnavus]MDB8711739.1 hypothetical protein [Mediterraneibacter gnavus]MDB8714752.1 hypothetical protein [Mediterraneibacter gnavus]